MLNAVEALAAEVNLLFVPDHCSVLLAVPSAGQGWTGFVRSKGKKLFMCVPNDLLNCSFGPESTCTFEAFQPW